MTESSESRRTESSRGTSSLRYLAPVAMTTDVAVTEDPSVSRTSYWPPSFSINAASAGTTNSAPNLRACSMARSASSAPDMPDGKPR